MATLEFRDIKVTVPVPGGGTKTILHGVSGRATPGRLFVIMGASGAGKSTLLDVLSHTKSSKGVSVEGEVLVDGEPRVRSKFSRIACYVQQRDVQQASATVKEVLTTSAMLRLPYSMPKAEKLARVDDVLRELDLVTCQDTLIGDEVLGMKGISGGQKRRVSVGTELIKDPSILFLDEPTSGLDSEMALSCMEALVRLARRGRTVVCTIHQPNSDITALFDDLMLMSEGHCVYQGPFTGAVDAFAQAGFPCPMYKNPTDYFMHVIKDHDSAQRMWEAQEKRTAVLGWSSKGAGALPALPSPASTADLEAGSTPGALPPSHKDTSALSTVSTPPPARETTPWWFQVGVLGLRRWRDWVRNPNMLASELLQYVFIALFVGSMYINSFSDDTGNGTNNRIACLWFSLTVMSFTPSYTAVVNWDKERVLLKRELSQHAYSPLVTCVSRSLLLFPFELLQCVLFVSIMYFFAGLQPSADKFFIFILTLYLFQLVAEGIGLACAIVTGTANFAIILLTFVLLLLLSFSGFLVSRIPVYFRWINKASFFTYGFSALVQNEFSGLVLYDSSTGEWVPGLSALPPSVTTQFSLWGNIGILAAIVVGMELFKVVAITAAHKLRRL